MPKKVFIEPEKFFDYIRKNPDYSKLDGLFIFSIYRTDQFIRKIILGDEVGTSIKTTTTIPPSSTTSTTSTSSTTTTTTTLSVNFYNDTDKKVSFALADINRIQQINYSVLPNSSKIENFNVINNPTINANLLLLSIANSNDNVEVSNFNGYEIVIKFNNGGATTLYSDEAQLSVFRGNANTNIFWFNNVVSVRIRYSSMGTTTTSTTSTTSSSSTTTSTSSTTSTTSSTTTTTTSTSSSTTSTTSSSTTSSTTSTTSTSTTTADGITVKVQLNNILHDNPIIGYQLFNNSDIMVDNGTLGNQPLNYVINNYTLPFKIKLNLSDTNLIVAQGNYNVKLYRTFNTTPANLIYTGNVLIPFSSSILTSISGASDTRNITAIITQIDDVAPTTSTTTTSTSTTSTTTSSSTTTTTTTLPIVRVTFSDAVNRGLTFIANPGNNSITPGLSGYLDLVQGIYTITINGNYSNTMLELRNANNIIVSNNPTTSGFTIDISTIRKITINPVPTTTSTTSSTSTTTSSTTSTTTSTTSSTTTTTTTTITNVIVMLEVENSNDDVYEGYFVFNNPFDFTLTSQVDDNTEDYEIYYDFT